jgi:hypothetical protein
MANLTKNNKTPESASVQVDVLEEDFGKITKKRPELKGRVLQMMGMGMGMMQGNPLHNKMTEAHLTQTLTIASENAERSHKLEEIKIKSNSDESKRRYIFNTGMIVIVLGFVFAFACVFKDKLEIVIPLITTCVGFGGGYGMGVSNKTKKAE